jgi:aquaporin Z
MNKLLAEAFGAFCLVFAGTGAIIVNQTTGGALTHVGVALTFGIVVMTMIYAIGDISGAHMNPVVTLGFVLARRMEIGRAPAYIVAQLIGALCASLLLRILFPSSPSLGATIPAGDAWRSLVLEGVLTFILMFVVLCVSTGAKEKGITAAIAVGGVVAMDALFGGPISGASMNPARSAAPALIAQLWPARDQLAGATSTGLHAGVSTLWVYLLGPIAGAALAVPFFGAVAARPVEHSV